MERKTTNAWVSRQVDVGETSGMLPAIKRNKLNTDTREEKTKYYVNENFGMGIRWREPERRNDEMRCGQRTAMDRRRFGRIKKAPAWTLTALTKAMAARRRWGELENRIQFSESFDYAKGGRRLSIE